MDKMDLKTSEKSAIHAEFSSHPDHVAAQIPKVTWWEQPGLRRLYFMMPILFLGMSPIVGPRACNLPYRFFDEWIRWISAEWASDNDPVARVSVSYAHGSNVCLISVRFW